MKPVYLLFTLVNILHQISRSNMWALATVDSAKMGVGSLGG